MTITITLNDEQMKKFNSLKSTRTQKSNDELFEQVVERGLYDLVYRTQRNRQQWSEFKAYKSSKKNNN